MPASDYDEDPRSKVCVESGLATIMKPLVGRRIYDNFRLKVMLCLIKAKCFDILWTSLPNSQSTRYPHNQPPNQQAN